MRLHASHKGECVSLRPLPPLKGEGALAVEGLLLKSITILQNKIYSYFKVFKNYLKIIYFLNNLLFLL